MNRTYSTPFTPKPRIITQAHRRPHFKHKECSSARPALPNQQPHPPRIGLGDQLVHFAWWWSCTSCSLSLITHTTTYIQNYTNTGYFLFKNNKTKLEKKERKKTQINTFRFFHINQPTSLLTKQHTISEQTSCHNTAHCGNERTLSPPYSCYYRYNPIIMRWACMRIDNERITQFFTLNPEVQK